MSKHTSMKTRITVAAVVVAAFAGLMGAGPPASAVTALADCTASLSPQYWTWTARCVAPHVVTIQLERRWYWMHEPSVIYDTARKFSREVVPGTPWEGWAGATIPEAITIRTCMTALQDATLVIAPRTCDPV